MRFKKKLSESTSFLLAAVRLPNLVYDIKCRYTDIACLSDTRTTRIKEIQNICTEIIASSQYYMQQPEISMFTKL